MPVAGKSVDQPTNSHTGCLANYNQRQQAVRVRFDEIAQRLAANPEDTTGLSLRYDESAQQYAQFVTNFRTAPIVSRGVLPIQILHSPVIQLVIGKAMHRKSSIRQA